MKLTNLLREYKECAKEMQSLAKKYRRLSAVVMTSTSHKTYVEYRETWLKMIKLNDKASYIAYQYRTLSESPLYKVMFALGIMPKQHGLAYIDESKTNYKTNQLMSIVL